MVIQKRDPAAFDLEICEGGSIPDSHHASQDIPEGSFEKAEETAYCKLWTYQRPSKPVSLVQLRGWN